jgi:hypothetical protein
MSMRYEDSIDLSETKAGEPFQSSSLKVFANVDNDGPADEAICEDQR